MIFHIVILYKTELPVKNKIVSVSTNLLLWNYVIMKFYFAKTFYLILHSVVNCIFRSYVTILSINAYYGKEYTFYCIDNISISVLNGNTTHEFPSVRYSMTFTDIIQTRIYINYVVYVFKLKIYLYIVSHKFLNKIKIPQNKSIWMIYVIIQFHH